MKFKTKKALKKRVKITKKGGIKRLQASRSHLRRHKRRRLKVLLNISKANKKIRRLIGK